MEKWKCIKSFSVTKFDRDENIVEDDVQQIVSGSIWDKEVASFGEIRLENDSGWLEITEETFENCFEKLEGSF